MSRSSSSNTASKNSRSKSTTSTTQTATTARAKTRKTSRQGVVDQMKYEIAGEFGVELGANSTARQNGQVGGEITKRLVKIAKENSRKNN